MTWLYHLGLGQSDPGVLQLRRSEHTVLRRSQMRSLHSTKHRIKWTAALVTTIMTWRQILHKLEVAHATMEFQVQSWSTDSELG